MPPPSSATGEKITIWRKDRRSSLWYGCCYRRPTLWIGSQDHRRLVSPAPVVSGKEEQVVPGCCSGGAGNLSGWHLALDEALRSHPFTVQGEHICVCTVDVYQKQLWVADLWPLVAGDRTFLIASLTRQFIHRALHGGLNFNLMLMLLVSSLARSSWKIHACASGRLVQKQGW